MLAFVHCTQKEPVVAKLGTQQITLAEFSHAYLNMLKQPNAFDSRPFREQFLDEMIRRRLLAEAARKAGLAQDERLQYRIESYRDKCLREAHFDQVIKPKIHIQEQDVENAYIFSQEQRRIRHLFTQTQAEADSLYRSLQQGVPFNQLAARTFEDTALARTGGDLGWITWDQMEYDLASAAFGLPLHGYSEPIKSQFGYHILQVVDYKKKPLITRHEYELQRDRARYQLEQKIGDKLAYEYIDRIMADVKIQVYPSVLQFVGEKLAPQLKRKPSQIDQMFDAQLSEVQIQDLQTSLWDRRQETLATINGTPYTVGEFVAALNYIPYDLLYRSYKTALDLAFRDFVLTQEAKKMNLQRRPEVKRKVGLFEEYALQLKWRRKLVRDVTVTEDDIRSYYDRYRDEKYQSLDLASVHDLIRDRLVSEKKAAAIPAFIQELSRDLKITRHPEIIHPYFDQMKKNLAQPGENTE